MFPRINVNGTTLHYIINYSNVMIKIAHVYDMSHIELKRGVHVYQTLT